LDLNRFGNLEAGFKRLRSLKDAEKAVVWLPTSIFPVAEFAFSSCHLVNAKVANLPEISCRAPRRSLQREGDAGTAAALPPASFKAPRLTLTGSKEAHKEVSRHFKMRVVTIPLDLMGHYFDDTIGVALRHFGFAF
jgi:hypothetical protein